MDAIGNLIGGLIGQDLDRIASEMICTSANYMSLAAENEKFPIPQVPLGPSLDWRAIFNDIGDLDRVSAILTVALLFESMHELFSVSLLTCPLSQRY